MPQRLSDNVISKLLSIQQFRFGIRVTNILPLERVSLLRQLADELLVWADCIEEFAISVASGERAHRDELRGIQLWLWSRADERASRADQRAKQAAARVRNGLAASEKTEAA